MMDLKIFALTPDDIRLSRRCKFTDLSKSRSFQYNEIRPSVDVPLLIVLPNTIGLSNPPMTSS